MKKLVKSFKRYKNGSFLLVINRDVNTVQDVELIRRLLKKK